MELSEPYPLDLGMSMDLDDSALNRVYDKAVFKAKKKIMGKLRTEMDITEDDVQFILGKESQNSKSNWKNSKSEKKMYSKKRVWKMGDACRAMYSEDGLEYEAKITSIIDADWCRVEYIGYGNEENVLLKDLAQSLGKKEIKNQKEMAAMCYESSYEEGEIIDSSSEEHSLSSKTRARTLPFNHRAPRVDNSLPPPLNRRTRLNNSFPRPLNHRAPMYDSLPPPPPMVPPINMFTNVNPMKSNIPCNDLGSEHFGSLLLSWYMCGYYTGYHAASVDNGQANMDEHLE